jgi:hypothetical protein
MPEYAIPDWNSTAPSEVPKLVERWRRALEEKKQVKTQLRACRAEVTGTPWYMVWTASHRSAVDRLKRLDREVMNLRVTMDQIAAKIPPEHLPNDDIDAGW